MPLRPATRTYLDIGDDVSMNKYTDVINEQIQGILDSINHDIKLVMALVATVHGENSCASISEQISEMLP